jgi:drug/metabolite transporter (DMT)-like permease
MSDGAGRGGPDRGVLLAFTAVVALGGANAIAVKLMVHEMPPFWSASIRFGVAGLILLAITIATRRELPRGRSLVGALAYGALGFAVSYGLLYTALRDVPASTAMVLLALAPLFTLGLAIAHRQERFRVVGLAGGLIAAAGIAIVFSDQLNAAVPLVSLVLVILGAAVIAESAVIVKLIPHSDPFATNSVAMLTGGSLSLVASLVAGEAFALPASGQSWLALIYLVLLGSVVMFAAYVFAISRWTASAISYTTLLMPLVTIGLAAALFSEPITIAFLVGGAVTLVGVYVGSFDGRTHKAPTTTPMPECMPVVGSASATR